MAGVVHESSLSFEGTFERSEHVVEGVSEAGDFVVACVGDVEPDACRAGGDRLGLSAVALHWCESGLRQALADDCGQHQGRESGERELSEKLSEGFVALVGVDTDDENRRGPVPSDRRCKEKIGRAHV